MVSYIGGNLEKYQENCHCLMILKKKKYFNFLLPRQLSLCKALVKPGLLRFLSATSRRQSQWGCRAGVYGKLLLQFKEFLL